MKGEEAAAAAAARALKGWRPLAQLGAVEEGAAAAAAAAVVLSLKCLRCEGKRSEGPGQWQRGSKGAHGKVPHPFEQRKAELRWVAVAVAVAAVMAPLALAPQCLARRPQCHSDNDDNGDGGAASQGGQEGLGLRRRAWQLQQRHQLRLHPSSQGCGCRCPPVEAFLTAPPAIDPRVGVGDGIHSAALRGFHMAFGRSSEAAAVVTAWRRRRRPQQRRRKEEAEAAWKAAGHQRPLLCTCQWQQWG